MKVFDTETFLKETSKMVKEYLPSAIDAVNQEKGDFEIQQIPEDAWYFQNLTDDIYSYPIFIVWGLYALPETIETIGSERLRKETAFFEVVLADSGSEQLEHDFYKLLRYVRALEATVQDHFHQIWSGIRVSVSGLTPTSFEFGGKTYRSAGVSIEAAIAN